MRISFFVHLERELTKTAFLTFSEQPVYAAFNHKKAKKNNSGSIYTCYHMRFVSGYKVYFNLLL